MNQRPEADFLVGVKADILILQEVDLNAQRMHCLNIAQTIPQKLEMNYVFRRKFQELTEGSRTSPTYHCLANASSIGVVDPVSQTLELLASTLVSSPNEAV